MKTYTKNKSKMNVGILHGCRQDNIMMKSLFKDYEKKIKSKCPGTNFFYLEGQYPHVDSGKMWYQTHLDLERIGTDDIPESDIIDTMQYVDNFVKENNINILVGFSQGGNVVSSYLRLYDCSWTIKCAIIMAGYDFPRYQGIQIDIPVLFIGSESDSIVNIDLKPFNCSNMKIMLHEKGHIICQRGSFITEISNWLFINLGR